MDYQRVYNEFIADRRLNPPDPGEYTENHHILPRSLGGGDTKDNLLALTAGDHFFAHLLLARIHGGGMWFAANMMLNGTDLMQRDFRCKRHAYEAIRKHHAEEKSRMYAGVNNPNYGNSWSEEQKKANSERTKRQWEENRDELLAALATRPPITEETREKLRGRPDMLGDNNHMKQDKYRRLFSELMRGRQFTDDHRANLSRSKKGVPNPKLSARIQALGDNFHLLDPEVKAKAKANQVYAVKPVICLTTGERFASATAAGLAVGICNSRISKVCRGKSKTAAKMRWAYIDS